MAEHSPQGARRGRSRLRKAVGLPALRRTVVARIPDLAFYRVDAKEVVVIGIRHAARDPATKPKPEAS